MVSTLTGEVERLLAEGQAAAREGDRASARALLTQVVERDPHNEQAWMWLSGVVSELEEQQICLENVLVINPNNSKARMGLEFVSARTGIAPRLPDSPDSQIQAPAAVVNGHDPLTEHTSPLSAANLVPGEPQVGWQSAAVPQDSAEQDGEAPRLNLSLDDPDNSLVEWMQPQFAATSAPSFRTATTPAGPVLGSASVPGESTSAPAPTLPPFLPQSDLQAAPLDLGAAAWARDQQEVEPSPSTSGAAVRPQEPSWSTATSDAQPETPVWDEHSLAGFGITMRSEDSMPPVPAAGAPAEPAGQPPARINSGYLYGIEPFSPAAFGSVSAAEQAAQQAGGHSYDQSTPGYEGSSPEARAPLAPSTPSEAGPMGPYSDAQLPSPSELPHFGQESNAEPQPWYLQPNSNPAPAAAAPLSGPTGDPVAHLTGTRSSGEQGEGHSSKGKSPATIACPRCRRNVSDTSLTCPHCGFDFFVNCPHCHELVDTGDARKGVEEPCPYCGKPINKMELGVKGSVRTEPIPAALGGKQAAAAAFSVALQSAPPARARREISFGWLVDLLWLVTIIATVWALSQLPVWLHLTGQY